MTASEQSERRRYCFLSMCVCLCLCEWLLNGNLQLRISHLKACSWHDPLKFLRLNYYFVLHQRHIFGIRNSAVGCHYITLVHPFKTYRFGSICKYAVGNGRYSRQPLKLNVWTRQVDTSSCTNDISAVRRRPTQCGWSRSTHQDHCWQAVCRSTSMYRGTAGCPTWQYNTGEEDEGGHAVDATQDAQNYRQSLVSSISSVYISSVNTYTCINSQCHL